MTNLATAQEPNTPEATTKDSLDELIVRLALSSPDGDTELKILKNALEAAVDALQGNTEALAVVAQSVVDTIFEPDHSDSETDIKDIKHYASSNDGATLNVLADLQIQDWNMIGNNNWNAPEDFKDTYRFVIEQSPTDKSVYFRIYSNALDNTVINEPLHGLSGVIEIRNGRPALSLGLEENDLPLHVESDINGGLYVHTDNLSSRSALYYSHSHGMEFMAQYYSIGDESWLDNARNEIAQSQLKNCSLIDMIEFCDTAWQIDGDHWRKAATINDPNGGELVHGRYEVKFAKNSTFILSDELNTDTGDSNAQ